jgi:signal peptidase II
LERWKKIRLPLLTILIVLFVDQFIKIYVKTHFKLNEHCPPYDFTLPVDQQNKAEILFIENPGMAFGATFGGQYGKLILSLFRIFAAVFGVFYIRHIIRQKEHPGYIFCVALIFAGAVGNIIDCAFYGLIFSASTEETIAVLFPPGGGYDSFLHGAVVDMFHLPFWHGTFPDWFPIWGGENFEFFSPIFNFADASISIGVILIFIFQRKFFKKKTNETESSAPAIKTEETDSNKEAVIATEEKKTGDDVPPVVS